MNFKFYYMPIKIYKENFLIEIIELDFLCLLVNKIQN